MGNSLVSLGSEASSNVLGRYICEFGAGSSDYCVARYLSEGWASEITGELHGGLGPHVHEMGVCVHVERRGVGGGDLEHVVGDAEDGDRAERFGAMASALYNFRADISSTKIEMLLLVPFRSFLCRPSFLGSAMRPPISWRSRMAHACSAFRPLYWTLLYPDKLRLRAVA